MLLSKMNASILQPALRALLEVGYDDTESRGYEVQTGHVGEGVYCVPTKTFHGYKHEKLGAQIMLWMCFTVCIMCLLFYAYHSWKATTGWEEVYVCMVERE